MRIAVLKRYLPIFAWVIGLSLGLAAVLQPAPAAFADAPTFSGRIFIPMGGINRPQRVAVGDFDGDGVEDLAVTNFYEKKIYLVRGNTDGTFGPVVGSYDTNSYDRGPASIVVGDLNNDGKPDLAVGNTTWEISIFINSSSGPGNFSFLAADTYVSGNQAFTIALGDFDGDHLLDLAVGNLESATLAIFLNGKIMNNVPVPGKFKDPVIYMPEGRPASVAVGDFNYDGNLDIVIPNWGGNPYEKSITVMFGTGNGSFNPGVKYPVGTSSMGLPWGVAVGDFNEDQILDIAVSSWEVASSLAILLGNADGTFRAPVIYTLPGQQNNQVVVVDLNGDGHQDLAIANRHNSFTVLVGNGQGGFAAPVNIAGSSVGTESGGYIGRVAELL